jgi:hypothetical protein
MDGLQHNLHIAWHLLSRCNDGMPATTWFLTVAVCNGIFASGTLLCGYASFTFGHGYYAA